MGHSKKLAKLVLLLGIGVAADFGDREGVVVLLHGTTEVSSIAFENSQAQIITQLREQNAKLVLENAKLAAMAISTAVPTDGPRQVLSLEDDAVNTVRWGCCKAPTASDPPQAAVARERIGACLDWNTRQAAMGTPLQNPGDGNIEWCGQNIHGSRGFPWVPSTPVQSAASWLQCFEHQTQAPPSAAGYWLILIGDSNTRIMTMSLLRILRLSPLLEVEIYGPSGDHDGWYHADVDYLVRRRSATGTGGIVARISQRFSSSIERSLIALQDLRVMRNKAGVIWNPNPSGSNNTASGNTNSQPSAIYIANSLWWMHAAQDGPFVGATPERLASIGKIAALALDLLQAEVTVVWGLYAEYGQNYQGKRREQMDMVDALAKSKLQHDPTQARQATILPISSIFNAGGDYCTGSTSRPHTGILSGIHYSFALQMTLLDLLFQPLCGSVAL
jgi:hypothetical protein